MIAVRMVQPAVYEIVDMVAMRHLFMSAVWTVCMRAVDLRRTVRGICAIDRDDMLVHVILVHVMEMTIVKIVHMAVMANRRVPALRAMHMSVVGMVFLGASGHRQCSSLVCARCLVQHGNSCEDQRRQGAHKLN
jgi:hypothetical protein